MPTSISRREFLQTMAGAAGVVLVAPGCGTDGTTELPQAPMAVKNSDGTFTVKDGGKLAPGTALAFRLPGGPAGAEAPPAIVFATAKGELRALSAKCTHSGCTVVWEKGQNDGALVCPCHGSRFDTGGLVLKGPATAPLTAHHATKKGDDAIVTIKA